MIRISAFIWVLVLALLGIGLFQVKYNVQSKEAELRGINKQIDANRSAIHVLDAEWSYLNDPTRLADLTRRHTDLTPTQASQIKHFTDLPPRPATAQPDLPALSSAAPNTAAPTTVAVPAASASATPTAGIIPVSATAGSTPSAAPAVASTIAAPTSASSSKAPAPTASTKANQAASPTTAQTASKPASAQTAKPGADEVIDAILADMQRQQTAPATPAAGDQ